MRKLNKVENKQVVGGTRLEITENSTLEDFGAGGLLPPKKEREQPHSNLIRRWPPIILKK